MQKMNYTDKEFKKHSRDTKPLTNAEALRRGSVYADNKDKSPDNITQSKSNAKEVKQ